MRGLICVEDDVARNAAARLCFFVDARSQARYEKRNVDAVSIKCPAPRGPRCNLLYDCPAVSILSLPVASNRSVFVAMGSTLYVCSLPSPGG